MRAGSRGPWAAALKPVQGDRLDNSNRGFKKIVLTTSLLRSWHQKIKRCRLHLGVECGQELPHHGEEGREAGDGGQGEGGDGAQVQLRAGGGRRKCMEIVILGGSYFQY